MSEKKKNSVLTSVKLIVFLAIIFVVARIAMITMGNGKITALEGYLYRGLAPITATGTDATTSDATSSNAQKCAATSSDATSSNAQKCAATSSNAQKSAATSSNAQKCAATSSDVNKETVSSGVSNTKSEKQKVQEAETVFEDTSKKEVEELDALKDSEDDIENIEKEDIENSKESSKSLEVDTYKANTKNDIEKKETVSFLESHKTYISIIGVCVLGIFIISGIVILDKKGIEKRKMKASQNDERKNDNK